MNSDMTGNSTKIDYTTLNNKYGKHKIKFDFILGLQTRMLKHGYFPNASYT